MDTAVPRRTGDDPDYKALYRQRGSNQAHEDTDVPPQNPTCRTQMALHQGDGGQEAIIGPWDTREGEPSGRTYEIGTNEYSQPMEDKDMWELTDEMFNDIFNEVINEEVLF